MIASDSDCSDEHCEADRDQRLDDVAVVHAAGVGGAFTDAPGLQHVVHREPDHDQRKQHRQDSRNDVDELLCCAGVKYWRKARRRAHARHAAGVGHAEQADRHHDVPFQLLRPDEADREAVAQQHVGAHDERQHQREPGRDAADDIGEAVDTVGQTLRSDHASGLADLVVVDGLAQVGPRVVLGFVGHVGLVDLLGDRVSAPPLRRGSWWSPRATPSPHRPAAAAR